MFSLIREVKLPKINSIFKVLIFILVLIVICITYSKWTVSPVTEYSASSISHSSYSAPVTYFTKRITAASTEKYNIDQTQLAKYIHLDLKGAPPKPNKFYESFFTFLKNLQMGVKGVLIEYEDMLPLERNLDNVSTNNSTNDHTFF